MMLHGVYGVLIAIGAAIVALTALGSAVAVVVGSYNRSRSEALRQDNQELRDSEERLEKKVLGLTSTVREQESAGREKDKRIETLNELVLQRAAVDTVLEEMRSHAEEARQWWQQIAQHLQAQLEHSNSVEELMLELIRVIRERGEGA